MVLHKHHKMSCIQKKNQDYIAKSMDFPDEAKHILWKVCPLEINTTQHNLPQMTNENHICILNGAITATKTPRTLKKNPKITSV